MKAEGEALRAGAVVERLRMFLSGGEINPSPLNLVEVVEEVIALLGDDARSAGVEITIEGSEVAMVMADRLQMQQVLLNLIRNAIEAVGERSDMERRITVRLRQREGEARVDVEDNGPGVSAHVADQLFEPFASAKPTGMGLGLLLSREIIRFHGGDLWLDRQDATGARFAFRLPAIATRGG